MRTVRNHLIIRCLMVIALAMVTAMPLVADEEKLRAEALDLNKITGTDALDGKLTQLARDRDHAKELLAVATKMAKDAKEEEQPFNFNANILLARTAQILEDVETGQQFFRAAAKQALELQSSYKLIQVYDGMIDLHLNNHKYDEAIRICQEFLELPGPRIARVKPFVMERLIQAKARQGKTEEALKLVEGLVEADEGGWYFVRLKAWVLREAGDYAESVKTYEEAISRLRRADLEKEDRERYIDGIRYILSGVYVDMRKVDSAAEQLQILLKKYPENATYHNDLGYIWADHDMKLDEAEKLIRKAIELDETERKELDLPPELDKPNAAYLDSLGWVLYKKGKYKEAKKYLLQAVELPEGYHIEILDHLADTHIALGEVKEAIKVWEEALKLEDLTPREKQRRETVVQKLDKHKVID